jgi:hypothetical protein
MLGHAPDPCPRPFAGRHRASGRGASRRRQVGAGATARTGSAACPCHYRDKDRREVDLLIEADGLLYPIECKKSAAPGRDALAGIAALAYQGAALGPGAVVCMVPEHVPLQAEPRVSAVPAWLL